MPWQTLGTPAPDQLAHTREQLHCVAQVVASVPRSLATPQDDWSHHSFQWDAQRQALLGAEIPSGNNFRAGVRVADGTAIIVAADGSEVAAQPAHGLAIDDLFAWLTEQVTALTGAPPPKPLIEVEDGLPEPCAAGQRFDLGDTPALAEIARYYENSHAVLQQIVASHDNAAPVRTWPHHMDMATLISLDPGADPETARSVSFGMQPGDGFYAEPYYYSSPWPYPEAGAEPALSGGGAWRTEGFTAAVLVASNLVDAGDATEQEQALDAFARSAIEGNQTLLS